MGRYGGEEFLLILPETDLMGGYTVAEKLRKKVEKLRLPMPDGDIKLSVSVGIAGFHLTATDQETRNRLIGAADQALYRAKERGRNRVEIFEESRSGPGGVGGDRVRYCWTFARTLLLLLRQLVHGGLEADFQLFEDREAGVGRPILDFQD